MTPVCILSMVVKSLIFHQDSFAEGEPTVRKSKIAPVLTFVGLTLYCGALLSNTAHKCKRHWLDEIAVLSLLCTIGAASISCIVRPFFVCLGFAWQPCFWKHRAVVLYAALHVGVILAGLASVALITFGLVKPKHMQSDIICRCIGHSLGSLRRGAFCPHASCSRAARRTQSHCSAGCLWSHCSPAFTLWPGMLCCM